MKQKMVRYNSYLPKKIMERLKQYARENEATMQDIIAMALKDLMDQKATLP